MELTESQLRDIYYNNSVIKAAKILKISAPTLLNMVKSKNIPLKGQGRKKGQTKWKII